MHINQKPINQLTEDDLKTLSKALGTPGLPFPVVEYEVDENGDVGEVLKAVESASEPMVIYSALPQERIIGDMYRGMPVPSMLPMMQEAIARRRPESKNRLMYVIGDSGFGKTHFAELIGRVRDDRGPIVIDCGDKNLGDLLFETALDYGESLQTAVDDYLQRNRLSNAIVYKLKNGLGKAFTLKDDGKGMINWDILDMPAAYGKNEDSAVLTNKALFALEEVCKIAGIHVGQSNALGLKMREGELIRAFKEGREIILDEYNKSKDGTDGGLQRVLQFLTGGMKETTVENKLKIHGREETYRFTFRRNDMPNGFFCTLTGNDVTDGTTTRQLSVSANSRLRPIKVGMPKALEWQHRISQLLTGLPLTTLYMMHKNFADEDMKAFSREMVALRKMGLSTEEVASIPTRQIAMLQNGEKTLKAIENIGLFCQKLCEACDPDAKVYETKGMQEIVDEIDIAYKNEMAVDFRFPESVIEAAALTQPAVKKMDEIGRISVTTAASQAKYVEISPEKKDITPNFGSNLSRAILQRIGQMTAGKPLLRGYLLKTAAELGIVEAKLKKGVKRSDMPTIEELLNIDPYGHIGGDKTLRSMRGLIFAYMKAKNPDIALTSTEQIPLPALAAAMETIMDREPQLMAGWNNALPVIGAGKKDGDLIEHVGMIDLATAEHDHKINDPDLTPADVFVSTFIFQAEKTRATETLWAEIDWEATVKSMLNGNKHLAKSDGIAYANANHDSGRQVTTVMLKNPKTGIPVSSHIFSAKDGENIQKTLIVTDGVSEAIQRQLLRNNITVVNKSNPDEKEIVQQWMSRNLANGGMISPVLSSDLRTALMLRNEIRPEDDYRPVPDIVMDEGVKPLAPILIKSRTV